jgi:hypothetical protein
VERCKAFPGIFLLTRQGKGHKRALFVRSCEPFGRIASYRFLRPDGSIDRGEDIAFVECFGGQGARQFGAFGSHTVDPQTNEVLVEYRWHGNSPADTPLDRLPMLGKEDFYAIGEITESILRSFGWTPIRQTRGGEDAATRVYDLTDEMLFLCNDGHSWTLSELRSAASPSGDLRCTASFHDPSSTNRTRCRVGLDHQGGVSIHDHATGVTHHEARLKPTGYDADEVAAALTRLRERHDA